MEWCSVFKNYVPANKEDRMSIMTNVIISLVLTGIPFLLLFYFFRENLSLVFFGVVKPSYVVMMGIIIFLDTHMVYSYACFKSRKSPPPFYLL